MLAPLVVYKRVAPWIRFVFLPPDDVRETTFEYIDGRSDFISEVVNSNVPSLGIGAYAFRSQRDQTNLESPGLVVSLD